MLALVSATEGDWHRTAALVEEVGSAVAILNREWGNLEMVAEEDAVALVQRAESSAVDRYAREISELEARGIQLLTVLDDEYPANLREIYNRPPFLFVRGQLLEQDDRAVAVVGTRNASEEGLETAAWLAGELANRDVTVLSGLARGIDTAAHEATLERGGRTVAILGHGILHDIHPPENAALATQIAEEGAVVSQFWAQASPTRYTFPMRNVITSGMGVGTVVIEAHGTSGAKMQARLCLEHGKRLFLVESLVLHEEWAQRYAERPGAVVVTDVEEIVTIIEQIIDAPEQLALC